MQWDDVRSKEVKDYITHLESEFSELHKFNAEMERMYLLDSGDLKEKLKNQAEEAILTLSPDPRVTSDGAIKLLAATDPIPKIPFDKNISSAKKVADKIEKFDKTLLQAMGRARENPLHYDAASSAIVFGQIVLLPQSTKHMVQQLKEVKAHQHVIDAAEETADKTPFLCKVAHPSNIMWDRDEFGICALVIKEKIARRRLVDKFGKAAKEAIGYADMDDIGLFGDITTYTFYDRTTLQIGIGDKGGVPLLQEDWDMPFIPGVIHSAGGSGIFEKLEEQIQPFLYTMQKSGMWNRSNLYLSAIFTLLYGLGLGPLWIHERGGQEPEADVEFDLQGPLRMIDVPEGHDFKNAATQLMDTQLFQFAHELVEQKSEEMTMYKQALGSPLGKNAPYSMVALMSQAGRLPLLLPQKKLGWAFGNLLNMVHRWLQVEGGKYTAKVGVESYELVPGDIPKGIEAECIIDLALPQDKLQESNVINNMRDILPTRFLLEEFANVGNYDELQKELWKEQYVNAMVSVGIEVDAEMLRQKLMPQPPMPPQGGMGGAPLPPEMMAEATVPEEMYEGGGAPLQEPQVPGEMM